MDNPEAASNVLSQAEVEAILASVTTAPEASAPVVGNNNKAGTTHSVQAYDFRSPVFLTPGELRRLRIRHEEFVRGLSASISLYLRMEFLLQMSKLETISYRNMLESLPVPSHLTLFRLNPLHGICLLDISPRLGLTMIDRMLGGPGHSVKNEREFTDIEKEVLQNVIGLVLKEYAGSWLRYQKLDWEIVEHENTARFLKIVEPDEVMLFLEMEARFGDCVSSLRLIIPYQTIENLVEQIMKEISQDQIKSPALGLPSNLAAPLYSVPVPVSAHWNGFSISLRELRNLSIGDTLWLEPSKCQSATVQLGALPKFHANVKRDHRNLSLVLNSKLT